MGRPTKSLTRMCVVAMVWLECGDGFRAGRSNAWSIGYSPESLWLSFACSLACLLDTLFMVAWSGNGAIVGRTKDYQWLLFDKSP